MGKSKVTAFIISGLFLLMYSCGGSGVKIAGITDEELNANVELQQLNKEIQENPLDPQKYLQMSSIFESEGNEVAAMSILQQGLGNLPSDNELRYNLGRIQLMNGREIDGYTNFKAVMSSVGAPNYTDKIGPYFMDVYSLTPIVYSSSDEAYPTVDSMGSMLYYQSNQNGNWDIYRVSLSGGTPEQLTDLETNEENPAVSPDNTYMLIVSDKDDARPVSYQQKLRDIYYFDLNSREMLNLTENFSNDYMPKLCKLGEDVAFVSERNDLREGVDFIDKYSNIFMMEPSGKFQIAMTKGEYFDSNPVFSCSRSYIFFDSNRDGEFQNIYRLKVETKEMKSILPQGSWNNFSPFPNTGDSKIVFVSDRDGNYELYLYDFKSHTEERLTSSDYEDLNPIFIPKTNKILFHSNRSGSYDIYMLDLDSKSVGQSPSEILSKLDNKLIMLRGAKTPENQ